VKPKSKGIQRKSDPQFKPKSTTEENFKPRSEQQTSTSQKVESEPKPAGTSQKVESQESEADTQGVIGPTPIQEQKRQSILRREQGNASKNEVEPHHDSSSNKNKSSDEDAIQSTGHKRIMEFNQSRNSTNKSNATFTVLNDTDQISDSPDFTILKPGQTEVINLVSQPVNDNNADAVPAVVDEAGQTTLCSSPPPNPDDLSTPDISMQQDQLEVGMEDVLNTPQQDQMLDQHLRNLNDVAQEEEPDTTLQNKSSKANLPSRDDKTPEL